MNGHRRVGLIAATAALAISGLGAASASAATPDTDSWTNHYDGPAVDCPTFTGYGDWVINHRLTVYFDSAGNAIGDLERIDFAGRFYNPDTQTSVADRGTKRFLDTFADDGSYASTVMTFVRLDRYVGEAGRTVFGAQDENGDQAELRSVGHLGFNDAGVAALCDALAH
ncbi:MAG TPA: hypothetical protein VGK16_00145 [Candidatus Limnocylindrales bacterium]